MNGLVHKLLNSINLIIHLLSKFLLSIYYGILSGAKVTIVDKTDTISAWWGNFLGGKRKTNGVSVTLRVLA